MLNSVVLSDSLRQPGKAVIIFQMDNFYGLSLIPIGLKRLFATPPFKIQKNLYTNTIPTK